MVDILKGMASLLKAKISGDGLDDLLAQAVSDQNWQASVEVLNQIANASCNNDKWSRIETFVWSHLKKEKNWRKILKTLILVDHLLKNGSPAALSFFKREYYEIRGFEDFTCLESGQDKGAAIREKARMIIKLNSNEQALEEERMKAKQIRDKLSMLNGNGTFGSSASNGPKSISGTLTSSMGNSFGSSNAGNSGQRETSYGGFSSSNSKQESNTTSASPFSFTNGGTNMGYATIQKCKPYVPPQQESIILKGEEPVGGKSLFDKLSTKLSKPTPKPTEKKDVVSTKAISSQTQRPKPKPVQGLKQPQVAKPIIKSTVKPSGNFDAFDIFDFNQANSVPAPITSSQQSSGVFLQASSKSGNIDYGSGLASLYLYGPQQVSSHKNTSALGQVSLNQAKPDQYHFALTSAPQQHRTTSSTQQAPWLSKTEKELIDLSDFGTELQNIAKETQLMKSSENRGKEVGVNWDW